MNRFPEQNGPRGGGSSIVLEVLVEVENTLGGPVWIARCLQYDICVQAKDLEQLRERFDRVLMGSVALNEGADRDPFAGIPRAPQEVWDKYHGSFTVELPEAEPRPVNRLNRLTGSRLGDLGDALGHSLCRLKLSSQLPA